MQREKAILNLLSEYRDFYIISDVGKTSREVWEHKRKGVFILQGAMGHSLSISLGLALQCPSKRFLCIIGDSALLMKLGSLATIFEHKPDNLYIVVLNNNCNDSTGGQPTSFKAIRHFLKRNSKHYSNLNIIDVEKGSRENLTRPNITCKQITNAFRKDLRKDLRKSIQTDL